MMNSGNPLFPVKFFEALERHFLAFATEAFCSSNFIALKKADRS